METSAQRRRRGIRSYIVGIFVASALVFTLIGGLFAIGDLQDARERGRFDAALAAQIASDAFEGAIAETNSYMASSEQWSSLLLQIGCRFSAGSGDDPSSLLDFSSLVILDASGRILCSSIEGAAPGSTVYADAPWRNVARANVEVSAAYEDRLLDELAFAIAAPVRLPDNTFGVLAAIVPTSSIARTLAVQYAGRLGTSFTIVDPATGAVLSSSAAVAGSPPPDRPGSESYEWVGDEARIFATAPMRAFGWRLYAGVRESSALAGARTAIVHTMLVVLTGMLVAGLAAASVFRMVARPLRNLRRSIEEAADAVEPAPFDVAGPTEVADVAARFNELIASRVQLEDRMRRVAYEDQASGLASRAMLADRLDATFQQRPGARPGLFLVQLDRFEQARESFGPKIGDQIIAESGRRLRTLSADGLTIARFGESSFALLLDEVTSSDQLVRFCGSVVKLLSVPFEVNSGWIELSPRVGIAGRRPSEGSSEAMISDALVALAEARRTGEPYRFFDGSLRQRTDNDARVEQELGRAIEQGELRVYYQPIVHLEGERIIGAEALVRWLHPERGLLAPDEFLPIAQRTGLIARIDRYVAAAAIQQAAEWHEEGRDIPVAFNLSAAGIWEVETREAIEHALAFTDLPPKLLTVELTEGALIEESHVVRDTLERLRERGTAIAIDDFGTGFSSLAYLRRFPIDQLKIDRSFTHELDSSRGAALTVAIMGIAEALRLRVVAEGVETMAQASALRRLRCHRAQGFLFSEPVPADRFGLTTARPALEVVPPEPAVRRL